MFTKIATRFAAPVALVALVAAPGCFSGDSNTNPELPVFVAEGVEMENLGAHLVLPVITDSGNHVISAWWCPAVSAGNQDESVTHALDCAFDENRSLAESAKKANEGEEATDASQRTKDAVKSLNQEVMPSGTYRLDRNFNGAFLYSDGVLFGDKVDVDHGISVQWYDMCIAKSPYDCPNMDSSSGTSGETNDTDQSGSDSDSDSSGTGDDECSGDDECPLGEICVDGGCEPGCNNDNDCPNGQQCTDGQCVPPPQVEPLCLVNYESFLYASNLPGLAWDFSGEFGRGSNGTCTPFLDSEMKDKHIVLSSEVVDAHVSQPEANMGGNDASQWMTTPYDLTSFQNEYGEDGKVFGELVLYDDTVGDHLKVPVLVMGGEGQYPKP